MTDNKDHSEILSRMQKSRVLCIGDAMLDQFVHGSIDRISPEAPIPVLLADREKYVLGGAANVTSNVRALGANATLVAAVGADAAGTRVGELLGEAGIKAALVTALDRPTILKTRFVCGGQQMLRVDREKAASIGADAEEKVIALATAAMYDADVVVLSDYKKGLLTDKVVAEVIAAARQKGLPVIVDPKSRDFARYRGCTVVTPNRKELETASGMQAATDDEARAAAMKIISSCGIGTVLATRGAAGMSLVSADAEPLHIPADAREVFDVVGAGDTVVAAFAAALGAGALLADAAVVANAAAGIVVGKAGTATARPDEIADALKAGRGLKPRLTKLMTRQEAAEEAERLRARGKTVGFTNGTFDLLHPGHISSIRQARAACDFLFVAINSDASVKRYKGPTRPVQDEGTRALILSAMESVDGVVIFEEDTPVELLKAIKPDVLVKGGQYKLEEVVGYDIVMAYGGRIVRADMEEGFSTTSTIKKMAS